MQGKERSGSSTDLGKCGDRYLRLAISAALPLGPMHEGLKE
jgi:hypothetical protein